jgi:hypothetical protein
MLTPFRPPASEICLPVLYRNNRALFLEERFENKTRKIWIEPLNDINSEANHPGKNQSATYQLQINPGGSDDFRGSSLDH